MKDLKEKTLAYSIIATIAIICFGLYYGLWLMPRADFKEIFQLSVPRTEDEMLAVRDQVIQRMIAINETAKATNQREWEEVPNYNLRPKSGRDIDANIRAQRLWAEFQKRKSERGIYVRRACLAIKAAGFGEEAEQLSRETVLPCW